MQAGALDVSHTDPVVAAGFDAFYAAQHDRLVGLAYSLSGNRWAAEELAQDAFADAYRRWDKISDYDDPAAWVSRVVANRAASRWRRLGAEARALARLAARRAELIPALDPADHEFWAAVRALPTRQAQAVALHYLDDLPTGEIARVLDLAEPTVRVHLFRGRRALAAALGIQGTDPTHNSDLEKDR